MSAFTIAVMLSAVIGPQVYFFAPAQSFTDEKACEAVLAKAEIGVAAIIARDPDALSAFGTVTGKLTRAYFVTSAECWPADD